MPPAELVIVAILGLGGLLGALASGGAWRRKLAMALALAGLALPFGIGSGSAMVRVLSALFAIAVVIKVSDLVRERPGRELALRVAHIFSIHDLRLARFDEPRLRWKDLAVGALSGALAAALVVTAVQWSPESLFEAWLRWMLALFSAWIGSEALDLGLMGAWALVGVELAPVQNAPIRSRTVSEFWARRWNSVVRAWLATMAFRPLARQGYVRSGAFASFALSAAIHAYLTLPALDWPYVAAMAAFFLLHGGIVEVERRLWVGNWSPIAAHAWTAVWFVGTGPLFLEPVLAAFGAPTRFG